MQVKKQKRLSLGRIDCDLLCRLRMLSNMLRVFGRESARACATAQRHGGRLAEALDASHQSPGQSPSAGSLEFGSRSNVANCAAVVLVSDNPDMQACATIIPQGQKDSDER